MIDSLRASGSLALGEGKVSDHTGQWADFHADTLFNGKIDDGTHVAQRRLQLNKPKAIKKYEEGADRLLEKNNVFERWKRLQIDLEQFGPRADVIQHFLRLNRQITELLLCAEKRCGRKKRGYAWSPALRQAEEIVRYWRHMHSARRVGRKPSHWVTQLQVKHRLLDGTDLSEADMIKELKQAWRNLRDVQRKAVERREEHLQEQADQAAKQQNVKRETALKSLIRQKAQRRAWQKIGYVTKANQAGALSCLMVPDPKDPNAEQPKQCKKWIDIDDSNDIHRRLLLRNSLALNAAHGTPPTVGLIADILGKNDTPGWCN